MNSCHVCGREGSHMDPLLVGGNTVYLCSLCSGTTIGNEVLTGRQEITRGDLAGVIWWLHDGIQGMIDEAYKNIDKVGNETDDGEEAANVD